jgi:O-antigen/teichoic acid export membrane protein
MAAGVPLFGSMPAAPPHISWWLCGSGIIVVLASLYANVFRGLLEAAMLGHLVNVGFAALTLLQYGALVLLALLDLDVRWLLGASAVVYLAIAGFHLYHVRLAGVFGLSRPSMEVARGIFSYGLRSYLSEVPINLMNPVVLYLFVLMAGAGETYGVLDISLRISGLAASALGALAMPFFAISASADAEGSGRANALAGRFLRVSLPLAIGACLVYGLAGEPFVRLIFGGRAHDIWSTSLIVLSGAILVAALEPIARLLMGTQRLGWLSMTRYAMLLAALMAIVALRPFAMLDRFSAALAIGYAVSALGLLAARSSWLSRSPQDSALRVG